MDIFVFILFNNIFPIFAIIFLGYILDKAFNLDVKSLSKLNFYVFVPAFIIVNIYNTSIETELLRAIIFAIVYLIILFMISCIIGRSRRLEMSTVNAFKNSVMFYNSGNFGLPLITLVFSDSPLLIYAISVQVMVLIVQNMTTNSIGFYNAGRGHMSFEKTIKAVLKKPPIYALALTLILKALPYDAPQFFLWPALDYLRSGLIPMALLTLGVQLSVSKINIRNVDVYIATFVRLIGGPILAFFLLHLLQISGTMAQVLFISSAVPSAVNTALIAVEFDNEPDFASQVVMTTTLLSAVTLTVVIYLSEVLF